MGSAATREHVRYSERFPKQLMVPVVACGEHVSDHHDGTGVRDGSGLHEDGHTGGQGTVPVRYKRCSYR